MFIWRAGDDPRGAGAVFALWGGGFGDRSCWGQGRATSWWRWLVLCPWEWGWVFVPHFPPVRTDQEQCVMGLGLCSCPSSFITHCPDNICNKHTGCRAAGQGWETQALSKFKVSHYWVHFGFCVAVLILFTETIQKQLLQAIPDNPSVENICVLGLNRSCWLNPGVLFGCSLYLHWQFCAEM